MSKPSKREHSNRYNCFVYVEGGNIGVKCEECTRIEIQEESIAYTTIYSIVMSSSTNLHSKETMEKIAKIVENCRLNCIKRSSNLITVSNNKNKIKFDEHQCIEIEERNAAYSSIYTIAMMFAHSKNDNHKEDIEKIIQIFKDCDSNCIKKLNNLK